jgi:hypothetical protein
MNIEPNQVTEAVKELHDELKNSTVYGSSHSDKNLILQVIHEVFSRIETKNALKGVTAKEERRDKYEIVKIYEGSYSITKDGRLAHMSMSDLSGIPFTIALEGFKTAKEANEMLHKLLIQIEQTEI